MNRTNTILQIATLIAVAFLIYRVQVNPEIQVSVNGDVSNKTVQSQYAELSDKAERELANIEATLANKDQWPKSRDEVQVLSDKLASIVNSLSPTSQERMLPRMVPRRWEIQAFWLMATDNNPPKDNIQETRSLADEMNLLYASAPIDSSNEIKKELRLREESLRKQSDESERTSVFARAIAATSSGDLGLFNDSIRELASIGDEDAAKLRFHLSLLRDIKLLAADVDQIEKIGDRELKVYGLGRLKQQALELKLQREFSKSKLGIKETLSELNTLEKKISEEFDRLLKAKNMEYQQWALKQIKAVKSYEDLKEAALILVGKPINPLSDLYKKAEESARSELVILMKYKMAPINPALLDEAVGTWYRKVFQDRFDKLDTQRQQTVINDFASTEKKSIDK